MSPPVSYETLEKRYQLASSLESWELLAMHSIACDESIPRIRLRMMKSLAGVAGEAAGASERRKRMGAGGGGGGGARDWK